MPDKINVSKLSNEAHLALNYALAVTRGGGYMKRFKRYIRIFIGQQMKLPMEMRLKHEDLARLRARGLAELGDLGVVEFVRTDGKLEPKAVHDELLDKAADLILADGF